MCVCVCMCTFICVSMWCLVCVWMEKRCVEYRWEVGVCSLYDEYVSMCMCSMNMLLVVWK